MARLNRARRCRCHRAVVRIHLQRIDGPESIRECLRVVANIVIAGLHARLRSARVRPSIPSPITAERGVKHDPLVFEKGIDLAACVLETGRWLAPSRWVGVFTQNTGCDGAAGEEPDSDGLASPLCSEHTTTVTVQPCAIALGILVPDGASLVLALTGSLDVAVLCDDFTREDASILTDSTSSSRVKGNGV